MVQAAAGAKADSDEYLTGVIGGEGGMEGEEEEEGVEVVEGEGGDEEDEDEEEEEMDTSAPSSRPGKDKTNGKGLVGAGANGGRIGNKSGLKKPKI